MIGRVIVHIGLPKTATSTLQSDVLPLLKNDKIEYAGVMQLREKRQQTKLFELFCYSVNTGRNIRELKQLIKSEISTGKNLIISEELFTVSEKTISWREKMKNIGKILGGLNYCIILTVREPTSAIFSYYLELYSYFSKLGSFSFCALKDEAMEIFHYRKLINELFKNFERERINVFMFEDIINSNLTRIVSLISLEADYLLSSKLQNHNKRIKSNGYVYTKYNITAKNILCRIFVFLRINNAKIIKKICSKLEYIVLKRIKVAQPSQKEMSNLKAALAYETAALDEYFGIKYE